MNTQCNPSRLEFYALGQRKVVGKLDGGIITSDVGGLLLRETDKRTGIVHEFAQCFINLKNPDLIEHTITGKLAEHEIV